MEAIWTGLDFYVQVYAADPVTWEPIAPSPTPLVSYCYFQDCTLYGGVDWVQRPGFGNPRRNLESEDEWDLFSLNVSHFYIRKAEIDLATVFNRDAFLYLEMWLCGEFAGVEGIKASERHVLKGARAANFSIGTQEAGNVEGKASFLAPVYLQLADAPIFQSA